MVDRSITATSTLHSTEHSSRVSMKAAMDRQRQKGVYKRKRAAPLLLSQEGASPDSHPPRFMNAWWMMKRQNEAKRKHSSCKGSMPSTTSIVLSCLPPNVGWDREGMRHEWGSTAQR